MGSKNGNRKHGRNKITCARYAAEGRREKSKARKLIAHLQRIPHDKAARKAFEALPLLAKRGHELPTLEEHRHEPH